MRDQLTAPGSDGSGLLFQRPRGEDQVAVHLDELDALHRLQRLQLGGGLFGVGAHHDDAAVVGGLRHHLAPGEEGPVGDVPQGLHQGGGAANGVVPPPGHGPVEGSGEDHHIQIVHGVDHDAAIVPHRLQLGLDALVVQRPDALEGDARHVLRPAFPAGLFLDVGGQGAIGIAEGLVFGELGLAAGHQLVAVLHIVDVVQGVPSPLPEVGAEDLPVHRLSRLLLEHLGQQLGLQGVVAPEGGVSPADDEVLPPQVGGYVGHVSGDLPVDLRGLGHGEAPAVGKDEKELPRLCKAPADALRGPVGVDAHVVDGLDPGGVVVQHHDLPLAPLRLGGQGSLHRRPVGQGVWLQGRCADPFLHFRSPLIHRAPGR